MPLTRIPTFSPNCELLVGHGCLSLTMTGMDLNSTSTETDVIDFFALAEKYGRFTVGSLQGKGDSAAGTVFVLALYVSNNGQTWTERTSSATGAGGTIVNDIDLIGGFQYGRVRVKTAEGGALTGSAFFRASRDQTN